MSPSPIEFFFDFASPYAWFAAAPLRRIAKAHGREIHARPMLLWAVLQERGMPAPLEHATKKSYLLHDMARSARYFGLPFRMPDAFPISSHLPARLFLQLEGDAANRAWPFFDAVLGAYFTKNIDLRHVDTIVALAAQAGIDEAWAREASTSARGKTLLQESNASAVRAGVWGSPYIVVDGESFFGADRLPQVEWWLSGKRA